MNQLCHFGETFLKTRFPNGTSIIHAENYRYPACNRVQKRSVLDDLNANTAGELPIVCCNFSNKMKSAVLFLNFNIEGQLMLYLGRVFSFAHDDTGYNRGKHF